MKKNIFLKITIVAIIIILLVITYFVFFTKHDTLDDIGYLIDLKENVVLDDSIDYLNVYKDNIIDENITSYNYEILHNDDSLYGKYPFCKEPYACTVCRIEPENNVHVILEAFSKIQEKYEAFVKQPVIVGNWQKSEYGKEIKDKYSKYENIYGRKFLT